MTFNWNVPGGTAETALVVRADAPPGDVARAALSLLDSILDRAAEAIDGPDSGDLRLEAQGGDLVLLVAGEECHWDAVTMDRCLRELRALGITHVRWIESREVEVDVVREMRAPAPGVDHPL